MGAGRRESNPAEIDLDEAMRWIVRAVLDERGWTHEQLGTRMRAAGGTGSQQNISRVLLGGGITLEFVTGLCRVVGEDVGALFRRYPPMRRERL